jgi:hypothetical protein
MAVTEVAATLTIPGTAVVVDQGEGEPWAGTVRAAVDGNGRALLELVRSWPVTTGGCAPTSRRSPTGCPQLVSCVRGSSSIS